MTSSTQQATYIKPKGFIAQQVQPPNVYRWLAAVLALAAILLAILTPHDQRRLHMPDPWSYEAATKQFSQGNWVLNDDQMAIARTDVRLRSGGTLSQYVPAGDGAWVFRQSSGYPLLLVPFYKLGIPRAVNLLLAVATIFLLYRLLAWRYNAPIAIVGVVLLVWSPMFLLALHYIYMDTFASGILLAIGGGIIIWLSNWEPVTTTGKRPRKKRKSRPTPAPPIPQSTITK